MLADDPESYLAWGPGPHGECYGAYDEVGCCIPPEALSRQLAKDDR